jgi:hypothetical protein
MIPMTLPELQVTLMIVMVIVSVIAASRNKK